MKRWALVAVGAVLALGFAASSPTSSVTAKKPPKPGSTSTYANPSTVHRAVCPTVVEYTDCTAITVKIEPLTGYAATSAPAAKSVTYNSQLSQTYAGWSRTVSHEMGGHHDAWNELIAKVGINQAWTDYYDLDYFGEIWAEDRYRALRGVFRDFSRTTGKELWLDCVGPVTHGYAGVYLSSISFSTLTDQKLFCQGSDTVMTQAVAQSRPS